MIQGREDNLREFALEILRQLLEIDEMDLSTDESVTLDHAIKDWIKGDMKVG
jgi:type IV secretory pathway VirB4 component